MKHWTEFENIDGATVYVNLDKVEAVLPWGATQSVIILNNTKIYTKLSPAQVIQMMNQMLGA